MLHRLAAVAGTTLVAAVAAATVFAGSAPAVQPHVALTALSAPVPADPPGPPHPNPPHPNPPHPNPPHRFAPGHDHPHAGWHYYPEWGWWPGVVTPRQCWDGHGHVDWRTDICVGGRFDGFRVR